MASLLLMKRPAKKSEKLSLASLHASALKAHSEGKSLYKS